MPEVRLPTTSMVRGLAQSAAGGGQALAGAAGNGVIREHRHTGSAGVLPAHWGADVPAGSLGARLPYC